MKIKSPQRLSKEQYDHMSSIDAIAEFNFSLDTPIPFLAEGLVRSAVFLKGLYHGVDSAIVYSRGTDSMSQSYSLYGGYYNLDK